MGTGKVKECISKADVTYKISFCELLTSIIESFCFIIMKEIKLLQSSLLTPNEAAEALSLKKLFILIIQAMILLLRPVKLN